MHYYYDVLANLDVCLWEFYEWEQTDNIVPIKKVPFVRVSEQDMKNFMGYQISFDEEWVQKYLDKTFVKNQKEHLNCILFSSTKNSILFEVSSDGTVITRSKLLIEDENNCNEVAFSLKECSVNYQSLNKISSLKELRQGSSEKHFLLVELNTLEETKNIKKCSYLYYEWFGKFESDLSKMIEDMKLELQKEYTLKIHDIAELIKMSYKERL